MDDTEDMNTSPEHTPRPWIVTPHEIAPGKSWEIMAGPEKTVAMVYWSEADARLIAAAPDLLKAATHAMECLNWIAQELVRTPAEQGCYIELERAVNKAIGRLIRD